MRNFETELPKTRQYALVALKMVNDACTSEVNSMLVAGFASDKMKSGAIRTVTIVMSAIP